VEEAMIQVKWTSIGSQEKDRYGDIEIFRAYLDTAKTCYVERRRKKGYKSLLRYDLTLPSYNPGVTKICDTLAIALRAFLASARPNLEGLEKDSPEDQCDGWFQRLRMSLDHRDVRAAMGPANHDRACDALNQLANLFANFHELLVPDELTTEKKT
jgi:hypothetical protein